MNFWKTFEKNSFRKNLILLMKIVLKNQEWYVINGETTIYVILKKGARQGDPISTFLCILVLDVFTKK